MLTLGILQVIQIRLGRSVINRIIHNLLIMFVRGDRNGLGCFVRGDKYSMGCFVQGGKSLWDVLSRVSKNGMGCLVLRCVVRLPLNLYGF